MLYKEFDTYIVEPGEPVLRSCWECNESHQPLRHTPHLHQCFVCAREWIHGRYLDSFATPEERDEFLRVHLTHTAFYQSPYAGCGDEDEELCDCHIARDGDI
jgi:hypothetical protein